MKLSLGFDNMSVKCSALFDFAFVLEYVLGGSGTVPVLDHGKAYKLLMLLMPKHSGWLAAIGINAFFEL